MESEQQSGAITRKNIALALAALALSLLSVVWLLPPPAGSEYTPEFVRRIGASVSFVFIAVGFYYLFKRFIPGGSSA